MALTRKWLQALGIEDAKVDEIIEQHVAVKEELNKQIADLKTEAAKVPDLEAKVKAFEEKPDSSDELNQVKAEFEAYKKSIADEKSLSAKKDKYKALLKTLGLNEKVLDKVVSVTDFSSVELDDEGNIKNSDQLSESLKTEWDAFITKTEDKGTDPVDPPAKGGQSKDLGSMSMEEYIAARKKE